jgi:Na+/proline symporter
MQGEPKGGFATDAGEGGDLVYSGFHQTRGQFHGANVLCRIFGRMNPWLILGVFAAYALLLFVIARRTRAADASGFFLAGRGAPWPLVAFGMLGASLSGVTFISVPGWVGSQGFTYMQMVLGYLVGYGFIMAVLMPLYYKLGLTSIYGYFGERFGRRAYTTGASFFLLSRVIGASFRLFLVVLVGQTFIFQPLGLSPALAVPITAAFVLAIIYGYTRQGGLGTIVWTDTLQTAAMLVAVFWTLHVVAGALGLSLLEIPAFVAQSDLSSTWSFADWRAPNHFVKHFLAGAFVAATMTGMDQDMMQKNLACRDLRSARLNMGSFSIVLVAVNLLFLSLGLLLHVYAETTGLVVDRADNLYPAIALGGELGVGLGLVFLIGLLASAFSSADSALTALTTSACVDIFGDESTRMRNRVHIGMTAVLFVVITAFSVASDTSVIASIFTAANYTYGPILGLFAFGLLMKRQPVDRWIPFVAIAAPILCYVLEMWLKSRWGFSFGFALLPVNGLLTFAGLALLPQVSAKPGAAVIP